MIKESNEIIKTLPTGLILTVKQIVELLVRQNYDALDSLTGGENMRAEELVSLVKERNLVLVTPPEESYQNICFIDKNGEEFTTESSDRNLTVFECDDTWLIQFDMWTEKGNSDFVLFIEYTDSHAESEKPIAVVNGLYVP